MLRLSDKEMNKKSHIPFIYWTKACPVLSERVHVLILFSVKAFSSWKLGLTLELFYNSSSNIFLFACLPAMGYYRTKKIIITNCFCARSFTLTWGVVYFKVTAVVLSNASDENSNSSHKAMNWNVSIHRVTKALLELFTARELKCDW